MRVFIALRLGNENHAVAARERNLFTQPQHKFGRKTPFVVLVIRAVICEHHFESHNAEQRGKQTGADIMHIHYIYSMKEQVHAAKECVIETFKSTYTSGGEIAELNAAKVFGLRLSCEIWLAAIYYAIEICGQPGYELHTMTLNSALHSGEASDAYYG